MLRRAMLKLAKYFAHLKEIVSGSAEASADAFLRHVAQAAELRSEDVSPFPLTGQRRSPKDVSPLEERSISQLYYERGDE